MSYWLSEKTGTGTDPDGNQIRPVISEHTDTWTIAADMPTKAVVKADHVPAFDGDRRISPVSRAALAGFAPDDGEADDRDDPDLAKKFIRRAWLCQVLGVDDFGSDLSVSIDTIARLPAVESKLRVKGIDVRGLAGSTTVEELMRFVLPKVNVRLESKLHGNRGTFTDDFSNAPASETDIASITPSGGTAWTRIVGSSGRLTARSSDQVLIHAVDALDAMYLCDDQSGADQYLEYDVKTPSATFRGFFCNRHAGVSTQNFIGVRVNNSKCQLFKNVSGTFTQLGSDGATTVSTDDRIRLECDSSDAHEIFLNASSEVGPVTDAAGSSNTRQGNHPRNGGRILDADNVEFGLLAAGGNPKGPLGMPLHGPFGGPV